MKRCWHASQLFVALMVATAGLAWETGCSRQLAVPASGGISGSAQLPFSRVSDSSGISPTAGFSFEGVPVGTEVTVRLQSALSSAHSRTGDSFQAVLAEPIMVAGKMLVPAGTEITGSVVKGKASGGLNDPGYLRVTLVSIVMNGKPTPLQTSSIFAKGGSYDKRKTAAIRNSDADGKNAPADTVMNSRVASEAAINPAQGEMKFSTGRRLTFRLVQPLHL